MGCAGCDRGALLSAAPASANVSHVFTAPLRRRRLDPGQPLSALRPRPTDVDVDQTSHDFYVTDPGNHRVEKFDSAGNFLLMFGKDVDQTTGGDVCTAASGDTCQAGTSGSAPGGFETPAYLAVDNSGGPSTGDIYVGDTGDNLVPKFDSTGHIISSWGAGGQKDGSDATDLPVLRADSSASPSAAPTATSTSAAPTTKADQTIWQYTPDGTYDPAVSHVSGVPWLKVGSSREHLLTPAEPMLRAADDLETARGVRARTEFQLGTVTPLTAGFDFDPSSEEALPGHRRHVSTTTARTATRRSRPAIRPTPSAAAQLSGRRRGSASTAPPTPSTSPTRPATTSRSSATPGRSSRPGRRPTPPKPRSP